jgi:hypothetical protein
MANPKFSRRMLLRHSGGAVALPLLASPWNSPVVQAALNSDGYPKRLLVYYTPNGRIPNTFWPKRNSETDFDLTGTSLQPLAAYKDRMQILGGIQMSVARDAAGNPHAKGMAGLLTGRSMAGNEFATGISLDQELANKLGAGVRLPSLQLGVHSVADNPARSILSYAGAGKPLSPVADPAAAFRLLFGAGVPAAGNTTPMGDASASAKRSSVMDLVRKQFADVKTWAGAEDRAKLEEHATMLNELEKRLTPPVVTSMGCNKKPAPVVANPLAVDSIPAVLSAHLDMVAAAFTCDLSRYIVLTVSDANNEIPYPWLGLQAEGHDQSHESNSSGAAAMDLTKRERWHAEQLATLLDKLAATKEGDRTVLDNTVVLYASEVAVGAHFPWNMPFVLIGNPSKSWRTGRYAMYGAAEKKATLTTDPHNKLLVSIANALGAPMTSFGDPRFGSGGLAGM